MKLLQPYYEKDGITIYNADCREHVDLIPENASIVSDPPYGMNADTDSRRFTGGNTHKRYRGQGKDWGSIVGDDTPFDPSVWLKFPVVCLMGYHHFAERLPTGTVAVWVKRYDEAFGTFLSDAELAWINRGHGVYCYRHVDCPPTRAREGDGKARHPTQKPIGLMKWLIEISHAGELICDPYCGSGTTLLAARSMGRKAIGFEIEERYCAAAVLRLQQKLLFTE